MFWDRKMRRTDDSTQSHFLTYYKDSGYYSSPDNGTLYTCKLMRTMANEIEKMTNIPQLADGRGYIAIGYTFKQHGFQPLGSQYENRLVSLYVKLYSDHRGCEQPSEFMEEDEYSHDHLYFVVEVVRDKYAWTHKLTGHWYMDRDTLYSPEHAEKWGLYLDGKARKASDEQIWTDGLEENYKGEFTRLPVRKGQPRFV